MIKNPKIFWAYYILIPLFIYLILQNKYLYSNVVKVMVLAAGLYLVMAVIYHLKFKSLTLEMVLEYLLIVVLAFIVLINF